MAQQFSQRGSQASHRDQLHRLHLFLDRGYLAGSLFLTGLVLSHQPAPAAADLAAVSAPALLWAVLLWRRRRGPCGLQAGATAVAWAALKALLLGSLLAAAALLTFAAPEAHRVGPWHVAVLNGLVLALELPLCLCRATESNGAARKLLLVGSGRRVVRFLRHLAAARVPVEVSGVVEPEPDLVGQRVLGVPVLGLSGDLQGLLKRTQVDEVVFLLSRPWLELAEQLMLVCEKAGVRVLLPTDHYPFQLSSPSLEEVGGLRMLAFERGGRSGPALALKQAMDFSLAAVALVVLAPLLALVAVGIKLSSPGPVLFRQVRCGLHGRRFEVLKFRTMVENAEAMKKDLEGLNEMTGPVFKIRHDPRVTPFGRLLRRMSLDELPQLVNVLRGEMSLVGPRPPLPEEVERYDSWQRRRLSVKPGLTCIWQTSGRNSVDFEDWVRMDIDYIDHWSLGLDLKLLAKTIPTVLLGTGA